MFGGDKEKKYKYVGLGVIGIVLVYLILRTLKFQLNIIEGLTTTAAASLPASSPVDNTDIENAPLAINNNSTMVEDTLLINKYKSKYEDIIIELDKNVDFSILQTILKNAQTISMNPTSNDSMKTIAIVNSLKAFKDSLNEGMTFMDSVATSSSTSS